MQSPFAWLLLLACGLLQAVAVARGTRPALLVVAGASALYLMLALGDGGVTAYEQATLASFWIAAASMLVTNHRMAIGLEQLDDLCDVDEATGCLNRRGFNRHLQRAISQPAPSNCVLSLLALDLDHFKMVNDRYGHLAGDEVLREVGQLLLRTVGGEGVVARMGGEEFAVLLPRADEEAAGVMAERILAQLRGRRFDALPDDARLTMSAGIAAEPISEVQHGAALRARADEALYAAKRSGRDRALLWPPGIHSNATPPSSNATIPGHPARLTLHRRPSL